MAESQVATARYRSLDDVFASRNLSAILRGQFGVDISLSQQYPGVFLLHQTPRRGHISIMTFAQFTDVLRQIEAFIPPDADVMFVVDIGSQTTPAVLSDEWFDKIFNCAPKSQWDFSHMPSADFGDDLEMEELSKTALDKLIQSQNVVLFMDLERGQGMLKKIDQPKIDMEENAIPVSKGYGEITEEYLAVHYSMVQGESRAALPDAQLVSMLARDMVNAIEDAFGITALPASTKEQYLIEDEERLAHRLLLPAFFGNLVAFPLHDAGPGFHCLSGAEITMV
ncbi:hypothetical protein B0H63DRAFT_509835 [Podospora didyma]|uniref:Uncharacterized protein n=1 Tax=Podospora didyma TaxID=330526 RepID=A0AAE0TZA6_9PEZI|nr:hypothetical protein B0H63DRAFT_509835 [Podospora didyma]